MRSRRFRWLGPVMLLALLTGAGLYWQSRQASAPDHDTRRGKVGLDAAGVESFTTATKDSDNAEHGSRFAQRVPAATTAVADFSALPPMPHVDAPLAEAVDDLLQRAEAGEPEATCRLLLDMSACIENRNTRERREMLTQRAASTQSDYQRERMIDFLAISQQASDRWSAFCADTELMSFSDTERLLNQALPRMSNRQRLLFTMSREDGSLIRLPRSMHDYTPRGANDGILSQFHADNDLDALEQGIAEADPLALEGKILLHIPTSIGKKMFDLREALPDPYKFTGYALMMQQLYGPESLGEIASAALNRILPSMDPAARDALQQQVDSEVERWRQVSIAKPKNMPERDDRRSGSLCAD